VMIAALLLAAGCATTSRTTKKPYYFFPPPPDEPRLQYLTAFSSEREFRGHEDKSLMTFLTGVRAPEKSFGKPYGAATGNKKIYVCDTDLGAVLTVDLQTRRIRGLVPEGEGFLNMPLNITVDTNGDIYIADAGRNQVVVFDKNENYVGAIGKTGELKPRDVVVGKDRIYIADFITHGIRAYDKGTREFLFSIPSAGDKTNYDRTIIMPTNLALDQEGRVYVADTGGFRVQVYDGAGNYIRSIGSMGDSPGQFARVKGIAVDREDRLYATDAMSQVTQIFDAQGRPLTWFGDPAGSAKDKMLPAKVLVDYDDVDFFQSYAAPGFKVEYLVMVINQMGDHKLSVYGFGERK